MAVSFSASSGTAKAVIDELVDKGGFYEPHTSGSTLILPWLAVVSGTGAAVSANAANATSDKIGGLICVAGTTTTGRAAAHLGTMKIAAGQTFGANLYIRNLSSVGEEFILRIGLQQSQTDTAPTDGMWLEYDRLTSVNWIMSSAASSTATQTASSTAVAAAAWLELKMTFNAAGTSVEYFVNGVSIGSVATNVPIDSVAVKPTSIIVKSAGTTSRVIDFSCMYAYK